MSQYFFNPLVFQAAQNRYRDRLEEMDAVLFPDGGRSLLDARMSEEEADQILEEALENRLHQGTVSGNLVSFARFFSGGKLSPDFGEPVRKMIVSLDDHYAELKKGIHARFSKAAAALITALAIGAAALLACAPARAANASAARTAAVQPEVGIAALAAAAGAAALAAGKGKNRRKKRTEPVPPLPERLCGRKEAEEVLRLIHCLADIYRNERA